MHICSRQQTNKQEFNMTTATKPLDQQKLVDALSKMDPAKLDAIWGKLLKNPRPGGLLTPRKK